MLRYVTPVLASALIIVAALGETHARSQEGGRPALVPASKPRLQTKPIVDTEATKPAAKGLSVEPASGGGTTANLNLPSTNARTEPCANSERSKTRVAIMKNSAVYAHCDFP
jgi:hypothetical protein